jgi:hypothetical protein
MCSFLLYLAGLYKAGEAEDVKNGAKKIMPKLVERARQT